MLVLGLSAFFHDSAAALVHDGRVVAAAQEERFSRLRHDRSFPREAVEFCLQHAGIRPRDLDEVVFYENPSLKRKRQLSTLVDEAPAGWKQARAMFEAWATEGMSQRRRLLRSLRSIDPSVNWGRRLRFVEHHRSHAAAAFYPSPFEKAAILTVDAVGELATTSVGRGDGTEVTMLRELRFPHSLGMLYSAFTRYLGFRVNSGEYKVMGLAPYGRPTAERLILDNLVDLKPDGSFRLDMRYFDYTSGLRMTNEMFDELLGGPPRDPDGELTQRHMDVASSIQSVTNRIMVSLASFARRETGLDQLCLAGGVALNCVANTAIARAGVFERIWVQPAAGDAGSALGAALDRSFAEGAERSCDGSDLMRGALLGPGYSASEVEARLERVGADFDVMTDEQIFATTVDALVDGEVVGWFDGRMEFGPRALGSRSILADPRRDDTQRTLNLKIKFREGFRPFAPVVLEERASEWFDASGPSPYMLFVADVASQRRCEESSPPTVGLAALGVRRSAIPAVTHVDGSARVQTLKREDNERLHALITAFDETTGCPVLVNTSFNVRGEPIVCTPEDAFRCFMGTEMDRVIIGNCVLRKVEQSAQTLAEHRTAFAPD